MGSLIDIIILYICSTLYILVNHLSTEAIVSMLVTLAFGCLVYYFDNRYVSLVTVGLFVVCTLFFPIYLFYLPLVLYLNGTRKPYLMELGGMILFIIVYMQRGLTSFPHQTDTYLFILCLSILACCLSQKDRRIASLEESNHQIKDVHSYMEQSHYRSQQKQRMEQDLEIRLATLRERNRIAREIHDNVGHVLSRSILQLGAILMINKNETLKEPLDNLKDSLNTAMTSIRESVHDLRDESLDLESMIRDMGKEFPNLQIKLDYDMSSHASKDIKYCFLAILKEALTNTVKHSNASLVDITIREHPGLYQLLIQDNGTPDNNPSDSPKPDVGMGLDNMRDRVAALGGNITFSNRNGFRIFIVIQKKQ